ncbi:MAG: thiamine diphosphokinase [Lachnospiraceae bacterium]|nr:thiamine diphosphokinase [Lachnospiraceae bacterium]
MADERIYIIAGGHVDDDFVKSLLCDKNGKKKEDLYILAVDRGLECLLRLKINPDEVIGDFDSVSDEARIAIGLEPRKKPKAKKEDQFVFDVLPYHIRQLDVHKDKTDTEEAVRFAMRYLRGDIVLLGATGTRIDHVLGNISILGLGILSGFRIILMDERNKISLVKDEMTITKKDQFGDFVSIVPYTDDTYVTLTGFRFNVDNKLMKRNLSLGISNVVEEDEAKIVVNNGVAIVIESRD